jgi:hypothetical protein
MQTYIGTEDNNLCSTEIDKSQNTPYKEKTQNFIEENNSNDLCLDSVECQNETSLALGKRRRYEDTWQRRGPKKEYEKRSH